MSEIVDCEFCKKRPMRMRKGAETCGSYRCQKANQRKKLKDKRESENEK